MYRIPNAVSQILSPWLTLRLKSNDAVFLTFDDGPSPLSTPGLIDLLNAHKVQASFFLTGTAAAAYPHLVEDIRANGHAVHLHGWSHTPVRKLSTKTWLSDLNQCMKVIPGRFYRPPYGRIPLRKLFRAKRNQIQIVLWNVDPCDYRDGAPDLQRLDKLLDKVTPGDIVLLHDKPHTLKKTLIYTDHIINKIHEKGYRLSTFF